MGYDDYASTSGASNPSRSRHTGSNVSGSPSVQSASGEGTSVAFGNRENSQNLAGININGGIFDVSEAGQKMTAAERASYDDAASGMAKYGKSISPPPSDQRLWLESKTNNFDMNSTARGASALDMESDGPGLSSSDAQPTKRTSRAATDALKERAAAHYHGKQANERGRAARVKALGSTTDIH